jgi:hypothetical protein
MVPADAMDWGDPERPLHRNFGGDGDRLELAGLRPPPRRSERLLNGALQPSTHEGRAEPLSCRSAPQIIRP